MTFQFAYLQVHSRFSPFGGLSEVEALADQLLALTNDGTPVAAALTDTFSLAAYPWWSRALRGSAVTSLAGAEIGVNMGGPVPYSLLLLVENTTGWANLSRLISAGLLKAGDTPLTASVDLETLAHHRSGLIAIAPYSGGPVMAALLNNKAQEGRGRAQQLLDIFDSEHFFIGAPPLAAQPQPQTIDQQWEERKIKANAALVKLSRDLKIGLVGTGEARYALPEESLPYTTLRHRLQRALSAQYPSTSVQNSAFGQDWLYGFQAGRPTADLQLYSIAALVAHYNERDWPGALSNNLQIATRCAGWQDQPDALTVLQRYCEEKAAEQAIDHYRLETELKLVGELDLAGPLLAAQRLVNDAGKYGQIVIPRQLEGSLVAYLLDLTGTAGTDPFEFEAYAGGRPLRLEVGQAGRDRLLGTLNNESLNDWKALQLAITTEPGELPTLHPRQLLVSLDSTAPLNDLVPLQPAQAERGLALGTQCGPLAPAGSARVEVGESNGVTRLQLALDILNEWRTRNEQPLLQLAEIPLENLAAEASERDRLQARFEWLRQRQPAAYFATQLQLTADPARRASWAEAVRLEGLKLLPPSVETSAVDFKLEGATDDTIQVGLDGLLSREAAQHLVAVRQAEPFKDLNDFIKRITLTTEEIERLAWVGALDSFGERTQLVANAPRLAEAAHAWQDWRQTQTTEASALNSTAPPAAQLTLFDLFDTTPTETPVEPAPVELAETPKVSRLEKLRHARQILGFFTAEHPLWDQPVPTHTDAGSDLPIALANIAAQEDSRPLLVMGLVTGIRRLPITLSPEQGQGEELTILQLEDFTGQAQLLVPRDTSAPEVQLEEGLALAARVNRTSQTESKVNVLIAVALAAYPALPGTPTAATPDDLEVDQEPAQAAPPEDESWSTSLFASLGIAEPAPVVPAPPAPTQGRGRPGAKTPPPAPKLHRRVIIHLPRTDSEESDFEMMNRLKQVLRKYAGEDALILYLPQSDGSFMRLEPQGLEVSYSEAFVAEVNAVTGPGSLKTEEFTF